MKLEQFREIADENLKDLTVDERMLQRVHQQMNAAKVSRRPAVPRRAIALAAACVAVMLVSGGVLVGTMGGGKTDPVKQQSVTMVYQQPVNSASTLSAHASTSVFVDGTVLSYGISQIGDYSEGYAAALASNGLYGYVNEEKVWVVKAMYESASKVEKGKAVVTQQGVEQIIEIPGK